MKYRKAPSAKSEKNLVAESSTKLVPCNTKCHISNLTEVMLDITLTETQNATIWVAAPRVGENRMWNLSKMVQQTKSADRLGDILGQVWNTWKSGLGLDTGKPTTDPPRFYDVTLATINANSTNPTELCVI